MKNYLELPGPYWDSFVGFLKRGVPLQYINKSAYFYKSEFFVDERVLIPRSETEILVEKVVEVIKESEKDELVVIEVGVGPGTIGLSLLQEISKKKIHFIGTDISQDALDVFKINQFKLDYKTPNHHLIDILKADRLSGIDKKADIIVTNPPYIKKDLDRSLVHNQVLQYEPHVALFLEDDQYNAWFNDLFNQVKNLMNSHGHFLMEGHESHLEELCELGNKVFSTSGKIQKDYTNRNRFLSYSF